MSINLAHLKRFGCFSSLQLIRINSPDLQRNAFEIPKMGNFRWEHLRRSKFSKYLQSHIFSLVLNRSSYTQSFPLKRSKICDFI